MRIQFTDLKECLVIDQFMKHLIGGSKDQWPPVGKSSDTPKEVKNARREELPTGNREARGYGAGCVYTHYSLPNNMKCIVCAEIDIIKNEEICEECYLDL